MLLDANVLLYAIDESSPRHAVAKAWVEGAFDGDRRVALPWQTLGAVARIATHPRVLTSPLSGSQVAAVIDAWLTCPVVWVPSAGERTARILCDLLGRPGVTGNLVMDAQLAALAIEHGLQVVSTDSDFARFEQVEWLDPLSS